MGLGWAGEPAFLTRPGDADAPSTPLAEPLLYSELRAAEESSVGSGTTEPTMSTTAQGTGVS